MDLCFLGAAGTVTGSRYLVSAGEHRVLIDCGLFQGYKHLRQRNREPLPFALRDLDAIVLTHAHLDHAGYLPLLVRQGWRGPVYCTEATAELCRILLPDSGRLQEEEAEFANRHGSSKHQPAEPLYTEADAVAALDLLQTRPLHEAFACTPNLSATLLHAGHILGSAMIRLSDGDRSILFSGDLGRQQDALMRPPESVAEADWLVVESTYGNRRHDSGDPIAEFGRIIRETAARGGVVLVPSFAVGRTQTLLHAIATLRERGEIPSVLPVFLNSPMARDVTGIYRRHEDQHRLDHLQCQAMCHAAHIVNSVQESIELNLRNGPMIIIAGSGMATGGRIIHHLQAFAGNPNNTIVFVGYQAGGTRGASILQGAESVRIFGHDVPIRARVELLSNLSAHADYEETLSWLAGFRQAPQHVFVTHGEPSAADALRQHIRSRLGWSVSVPAYLSCVDLMAPPATATARKQAPHTLQLRRAGIDTYQEPVAYLRADSAVVRSEGFEAQSRVKLTVGPRNVIATLNFVQARWLADNEVGISEAAWQTLQARDGDTVLIAHPEPVESFAAVRGKVYGHPFSAQDLSAVIRDVAGGRYSALELAAFVTACGGDALALDETIGLTRAMVDVGERLHWNGHPVADKHCVGGLPGNRTTPIVVAICAACGLTMPKTSSRAITSPAGTADTMEVLTPVALDLQQMRRVVEQEGGCIVWGGAMGLSPADDVLIRVERPLDFDSDGQLAASVLSKKIAAGSSHLVLDIPVGPTAKVRSATAAASLSARLSAVATAVGLTMRVIQSDGRQPVGRGIGPALEARDVLKVLRGEADAPADLRERALTLAGHLLELVGQCAAGTGVHRARKVLASGAAWRKFQAICQAQGGLREPELAPQQQVFTAESDGAVSSIDNRRLSRIAKLAGAPIARRAGLDLHVRLGEPVQRGQPLFTLHAESPGELAYAAGYASQHRDVIRYAPTGAQS